MTSLGPVVCTGFTLHGGSLADDLNVCYNLGVHHLFVLLGCCTLVLQLGLDDVSNPPLVLYKYT